MPSKSPNSGPCSPMPTDVVIGLTTWPDREGALEFAKKLVEEKLAACVNVLPPMTSVYRWEGNIERGEEHQLIIKTTNQMTDIIASRLESTHPYQLAEWLPLPALQSNHPYLNWIRESAHVD